MVKYNELIKKDFNINKDSIPLDEQKKKSNEFVEENSFRFKDLEKRIHPDNLIFNYKNEKTIPKSFKIIKMQ